MNIFDNISPIDFRYYGASEKMFQLLQPFLSENALIKCMARVEAALTTTLAKKGLCTEQIAYEIKEACKKVNADDVYKEENRIKHNVRALVNCIRKNLSDEAKPFVHLTATSHDIICTAESLRVKETTEQVLLPHLIQLENTLIEIARREKNTLQIGRTHGQHAEPITFGFTISEYVSRLGTRIKLIKQTKDNLKGQLSGAVGAYNASSLFFDPIEFEKEFLNELNLKPATHSTQVVEPEFMLDYYNAVISCFGVLANLSDDMRHLQRSEIAEIGEEFEAQQVGSSTMPHKRNPINFENVKAMWKTFMPRILTPYQDQISEHQRDLTNSASSRFNIEMIAALIASTSRLNRTMKKLVVDKTNLQKNFDMHKNLIAAEPLYILLAHYNHPDAHEAVRKLTLESQTTNIPLQDLALEQLKPYLEKFTEEQLSIIKNPENYTGISSKKVDLVCDHWEQELK